MVSKQPYEAFDHTADIGLHAFGDTLAELFIHAAQGMESLMVAPEQVRVVTSREITVEGHNAVSLLIGWLNELIFLFDTEYLLFRDFEFHGYRGKRRVISFGWHYDFSGRRLQKADIFPTTYLRCVRSPHALQASCLMSFSTRSSQSTDRVQG